VKDEIIERLKAVVGKQMDEMKTMKTVICIPVLRNQLNQYETRGTVYEDLLHQCEQIIKYAWKGEAIKKPILPFAAHSSKRSDGSLTREILQLSSIRNPFNMQLEPIEIEKFLGETLLPNNARNFKGGYEKAGGGRTSNASQGNTSGNFTLQKNLRNTHSVA
jgi:hypothetical protein